MLEVFSAVDPILNRTISFSPSGEPQASTRILSISKHWALIALKLSKSKAVIKAVKLTFLTEEIIC